jgi:5'(3')-deoxyribonucleotidase
MKKFTILLDMDGVLANFHQGTCGLFGVNLAESTLPLPWPYAIEKNISQLLGYEVGPKTLWNTINQDADRNLFWEKLKPYGYAYKLIEMLQSFSSRYGVDIIISTSPGHHDAAHSQKVRWIKSNTPFHVSQMMIGSHKHLMAKPETFLIDDCDANIRKFKEHGGNTFLWPQRWNQLAEASTGDLAHLIAIADLNAELIRWAMPMFQPTQPIT